MGYKGGYNEARRWNREQYNLWNEDYAAAKERYQQALAMGADLKTSVLSQYDTLTDQEKIDYQRAQDAALAAQNQNLASRGISNSSIANNVYAGNRRETAYGLNRLADQRLQGRLGYEVGLTADQINLLQAGPTAPSTAMFQATTNNLQAAMSYRLQQEAAAYARQGPNMSWSRWASGFTAPGNVESMAWDALSYASQTATGNPYPHQNSDPYYGGGTGYSGGGGGGGYGSQTSSMTGGGGGGQQYGGATQQATGGMGGGPIQGGTGTGTGYSGSGYYPVLGAGGTAVFV